MMLPLTTLDLITRYLDSVDRLVSNDLSHMPSIGETTLTDNFCALLDDQEAPGRVHDFSLANLKDALSYQSGSYQVDVSIENIQFTDRY